MTCMEECTNTYTLLLMTEVTYLEAVDGRIPHPDQFLGSDGVIHHQYHLHVNDTTIILIRVSITLIQIFMHGYYHIQHPCHIPTLIPQSDIFFLSD